MRLLVLNHITDQCEHGLLAYLARNGHEVRVLSQPSDPALKTLREYGVTTSPLDIRHRFDGRAVRVIQEELQRKDYDCVFAPTSRGITALIAAGKQSRAAFITYRGTMGHLSKWSIISRRAHLNKRVDAIVCNCNAVKQYLLGIGVGAEKLRTIYKGHDPAWYRSKVDASGWAEQAGNYIVCIANIRKCKGVDVLIKSFAQIAKDLPDKKLFIAGKVSDDSIPRLISKLKMENRIVLLGYRSDTNDILKHAQFSVNPSVSREGVPRALIESMSHAVPAVVTNVGGMPEIVQDCKTGLVVPHSDPNALAAAMRTMASSPETVEQYGRQARQFVEHELSVENYAGQFTKLCEDMIAARSKEG